MTKLSAKRAAVALAGLTIAGLSGCTGTVTSFFDPNFLGAIGAGPRAAVLPGDAPALVVTVENRTSKVITATVSYRGSNGQAQTYITQAQPGDKTSRAVVCSVSELTVGNISDLSQTGVVVTLGNGDPGDPTIDVEPFGVLLREGSNYDCGDAVTFAVLNSGATRSGYQVYAFIQRSQ